MNNEIARPEPANAGTTDEETRAALATIPGLDVELGLKTVRGRVGSLKRLLGTYAKFHGDDMDALRRALAAGDVEAARRIAHTLKGGASTIGLVHIQNLAAQLETAFLTEQLDAVDDLIAALDTEQAAVLAAVGALSQQPSPESVAAADR
jgi:HPt (histidine-containing phosphotransfer) domain-containing protein